MFEHFGLFAEGTKRLLVGFTATPRRGDKQALSEVFEEIAYARSLPEMVRAGYLCPVRGWRVATSIDIAGVRMRHGDFVESDLARAVHVPGRNQLVVDSYEPGGWRAHRSSSGQPRTVARIYGERAGQYDADA